LHAYRDKPRSGSSLIEAVDILGWALRARRLDRIGCREQLHAHQARWLGRLVGRVLPRSPFYAALLDTPFETWPVMTKPLWMEAFDRINTRGVRLADALAAAEWAERSRDFRPTIAGLAVGLSTGTSGRRGVFLVSPAERRRWAGLMLAKLLPGPGPCRVAFLLRADSRLYQEARRSHLVAFRFFDLLQPLEAQAGALQAFAPDVLIAPPSALRVLAGLQRGGALRLRLRRMVSVAEVLHPDDRAAVESAFGLRLDEVYQATEGCLALPCERGGLHLNEAFVQVEPRWIDQAQGRFSPVITDLTRAAQPVVRYALDDVLVRSERPCPCGRASMTLAAVEGRADEVCWLLRPDGVQVRVFPDFLARALLGANPNIEDFRIVQRRAGALEIALCVSAGADARPDIRAGLHRVAKALQASPPAVSFVDWGDPSSQAIKRRRIVNLCTTGGNE
jgi:putative adenylate-forming enzyme